MSTADKRVKIAVLDDDPTGTQTVSGVYVYTAWDDQSLADAFADDREIFYILTNTRSLSAKEAEEVNQQIARGLLKAKEAADVELIVISRGDSTLRGHYPLETETLYNALGGHFDGEVIAPCFFEGGRFTWDDVHYALQNGVPIPVGDTEFARDSTFGFSSSHLGAWIEEKTRGQYQAAECVSLYPDDSPDLLAYKLNSVSGFRKIIVNARSEAELSVCVKALEAARLRGKRFLYRTAASFPKVLAGIPTVPPLDAKSMISGETNSGGLCMIGSYTNKTTQQFETLLARFPETKAILFHSERALIPGGLEEETADVCGQIEKTLSAGQLTVVYTQRTPLAVPRINGELALKLSVRIADAFTAVAARLRVKPLFLIAKGGITSSKIATDALAIRKALVLGQAALGVPVWQAGVESRFPGMPYIVFPGNVGERDTLADICGRLLPNQER